jgi:hypothetical protein
MGSEIRITRDTCDVDEPKAFGTAGRRFDSYRGRQLVTSQQASRRLVQLVP